MVSNCKFFSFSWCLKHCYNYFNCSCSYRCQRY